MSQDKERFTVPRSAQQMIPIDRIWPDGIFQIGSKFSKSWKITDINYVVASEEDQVDMFMGYSALLNSLDASATAKITICNRRLNIADFRSSILLRLLFLGKQSRIRASSSAVSAVNCSTI
jgi:hypothetical protein